MKRVEDIVLPNGKLKSEVLAKHSQKGGTSSRVKKVSTKQAARERMLAKKKRELWDAIYDTIPWGFPVCPLCGWYIYRFEESELDHKIPRHRGGDGDENLHLVHKLGNAAKGSVELSVYLQKPLEERRKLCGVMR